MKPVPALLLALLTLGLLPSCATRGESSEAAWRRAQCDQVIDAKAREKCRERVDAEYGKR